MILFVLAVAGMTQIIINSEIIRPVDDWAKEILPVKIHHGLFECFQCSGFWCGILLGAILVSFNPFVILACGCAGSFVADLSESIFKTLERNNAS